MGISEKANDFLRLVASRPNGVIRYEDVSESVTESDFIDRTLLLNEIGYVAILHSRVSRQIVSAVPVVITPEGRDYLERLDQANQQATQEEAEKKQTDAASAKEKRKDRRHDYFVAIFSFILGVISTLVLERKDELVAFIENLFH